MSAIPTEVTVPEGTTWTAVVSPVGAESIALIQQRYTSKDYEWRVDTSLPATTDIGHTSRPEMAREWLTLNMTATHGLYVRHNSSGDIFFAVSVETV